MDKELRKQLAQWHEDDEYQKIVDAILAIPEEERDYELIGQLARALNNLGDYETATEMLLMVEEDGLGDPLWHYRLGYAYYYSDRFEQAREKFEQVLKMTPEDQDARMFLEWCVQELTPEGRIDKLNHRLTVKEAMMVGKTFRQRTEEFWDWFTLNEAKLAEMVEKSEGTDAERMIEFVSEGVRLISEEINFNVGGDHEFTFAVEGNNYLFYLLPWLVARIPGQFRSKWHFFPCMQGTHGESFGFKMYDKDVQLDQVMVGLKYDQEQNYFDVRFFNEQLCTLEENHCYNAFYIMMELAIGESMSRIYINNVDKADSLETGMFPLTKLDGCIEVALEYAGKEILTRPDERYGVYKMQFEENKDLRYDMVIGTTCFSELVGDYFNGETVNADQLETCGAKAVFLVMPMGKTERSDMLKLRYELEDRLVSEILGEKGSGHEIGILLGGTMGNDNLYIDLLLYDISAFMSTAMDWLKQYPYPFYLAEFRPESCLVAMANVEAKVPEIPTEASDLARQMMRYLDCPCEWFAPMADAESLDKAYFDACEAGKREGFVPVLVVVDDALMECLIMNADEDNKPDFNLENVRAYRRRILEETELPDAVAYFKELRGGREEEWADEEQWAELMGEMKDGHPNNDLAGYWNYDTRLTNEVLLAKIPIDQPWKIFAWLPMGNWNECPDTTSMMSVAKYWCENYGAFPALIAHDVLEFQIKGPVRDANQAMKLALEHYAFCPDCIEQCGNDDTVGKRADSLRQSTIWYFWWDLNCKL